MPSSYADVIEMCRRSARYFEPSLDVDKSPEGPFPVSD